MFPNELSPRLRALDPEGNGLTSETGLWRLKAQRVLKLKEKPQRLTGLTYRNCMNK